jgi:hypothetical protein
VSAVDEGRRLDGRWQPHEEQLVPVIVRPGDGERLEQLKARAAAIGWACVHVPASKDLPERVYLRFRDRVLSIWDLTRLEEILAGGEGTR